ncbi:hypothetical protein [Susfortunavirus gdyzp5]|uniref:Uncharacterized protein n=1 Tax=Clostridium phage vB_CP_qdyz_P5 TaxID=3003728 RepID=A0AAE9VGP8_9CAUD|nr:hypothetical protein [Clostridium phage vB_CP_qdyz_P5]
MVWIADVLKGNKKVIQDLTKENVVLIKENIDFRERITELEVKKDYWRNHSNMAENINRKYREEFREKEAVISFMEKENESLKHKNEELKSRLDALSEMYEVKKKASDYWFDKYNLTKEELNKSSVEKKELVNSIEKLKFERDMNLHSLEVMKDSISVGEERISELEWLNEVLLMVIHECCQSEDEIIRQYLDKKLNLLIDQNAPECMKTLIQNLIDELIVNK